MRCNITAKGRSHRKVNKYYDRKFRSEECLVSMLCIMKTPRIFNYSVSVKKKNKIESWMSDLVKIQCGKLKDDKLYTQQEVVLQALNEIKNEVKKGKKGI